MPESKKRARRAPPHPRCFDTQKQWVEYIEARQDMGRRGWKNYCTDCTPDYKDKMVVQGRCAFPRVIFIVVGRKLPDKELIGVRK